MTARRLSVCYAAPGQKLLSYAGPTRNVLSVANALSQWADVTVAFRSIVEPIHTGRFRAIAIDSRRTTAASHQDDNATRGVHPIAHLSYCRTLREFAREQAASFDVVLEKGWRLSGLLSAAFRRRGVPGILVENDVRCWVEPVDDVRQLAKYALHVAADRVASSCSRRASMVVAETVELKNMLVDHRNIPPDRVTVVGLGVDHSVFHPMDPAAARRALAIGPDVIALLYVGAMDEYHDLEPVIEAVGRAARPNIELHVVGAGEYQDRYEAKARHAGTAARFHGHVPHTSVPQYIAAADLCVSAYRTSAWRGGAVPFSTLKIPEYMACGRAVVGVPGGTIQNPIADGITGFVLPNEVEAWAAFVHRLPSRERLALMGEAAARAVESLTWDTTAARYLAICESLASNETRHGDKAVAPSPAALPGD
jgi:glycosyltransferase involved in cell wall biosynthesis